jgi:hypothetical protein
VFLRTCGGHGGLWPIHTHRSGGKEKRNSGLRRVSLQGRFQCPDACKGQGSQPNLTVLRTLASEEAGVPALFWALVPGTYVEKQLLVLEHRTTTAASWKLCGGEKGIEHSAQTVSLAKNMDVLHQAMWDRVLMGCKIP